MHYALLIYERPANYEGLGDDERRAMTAEYMAVGEDPRVVGSAHLQPTSMATSVRVSDGDTLVTDGPFADTKDVFGGYYVIEADDLDARDRARREGAGRAHGRLRRGPPGAGVPALIEDAFRDEWGRVLATLIGLFGDFDLAEEAAQDAFAVAAERWPREGVPANPRAWLVTVARNRALDRLRRERVLAAKRAVARGAAWWRRTTWTRRSRTSGWS